MKLTTPKYPNKINLGCGYDYLQGYLNIDFYNNAVADLKMSVTALDLPQNYFKEILLKDVIEHFGYCNSYYIFAKIYPLLQDNGLVNIITPDIEKAFTQYSSTQSIEDKENILCHIYGTEDAGMIHKFCFPLFSLENLLQKSGFKIIDYKIFEEEKFRPSMHLIIQKTTNASYEKRSHIIKLILSKKNINITYSDFPYFESVIEDVVKLSDSNKEDIIKDFFNKYMYISPKLLLFLITHKCVRLDKYLQIDLINSLRKIIKVNIWMILDKIKFIGDYGNALQIYKEYSISKKNNMMLFKQTYISDFFTPESYYKYLKQKEALFIKNDKIIR